jgi:hypothetical protein
VWHLSGLAISLKILMKYSERLMRDQVLASLEPRARDRRLREEKARNDEDLRRIAAGRHVASRSADW